MGALEITFVGANIYIPHQDKQSLMVVLPNGTGLGKGRKKARDGTPMEPHWPVFYERTPNQGLFIPHPYHFAGDRLTFEFEFTSPQPPGNFSSLTTLTSADWLAVDTTVIASPDSRVAAFALLAAGVARPKPDPVGSPCGKSLFPRTPGWSVDRTVLGVEVTIREVKTVKVRRTSFVGVVHQRPILHERRLGAGDKAYFILGNLCGGKVLEQTENSDPKKLDEDFKWVYELSTSREVEAILSEPGPLSRPRVDARGADPDSDPHAAFFQLHGGGGLNGCECGGYLANRAVFS